MACTAAIAAAVACSAGGQQADSRGRPSGGESGTSGSSSGSSTSGATSGGTGTATGAGTSGGIDIDTDAGDGEQCNSLDIPFETQIPTVFVLVDRSGSMAERGFWEPLRTAVLEVLNQLQTDVRFGFATFTGTATTCPLEYESVGSIALDNYDAIAMAYNAQAPPEGKSETPTAAALQRTVETLQTFSEPGDKYILLVTDGEPDFCDDGNEICRIANTTRVIQEAYTAGIGTLVLGLPGSDKGEVYNLALQDFANAGAGQPVSDHNNRIQYEWNQCITEGTPPADVAEPLFSQTDGMTPYYTPNVQDKAALVSAIGAAIAGVKSCIFDLNGQLEVDLDRVNLGKVYVDNTEIAYDTPDGWHMLSETQLELQGAACALLRDPNTMGIHFDFPCDVITLR